MSKFDGKKPSANSALFALVTVFLDAMGIGLILPVMPDLIQELTSADLSQAAILGGYLSFAYALMQFLVGPTLGNLSDRFGRRPILLASLTALALDYLIMGFAPTLFLLFVGRIIAGMAGATHTVAFAFVADISQEEERTKNFGLVSAGFGLGFIAGPIVGGLAAELGVRAPFFVAAGLVFVNFIYGLLVFPETLSQGDRRDFSWKRANPVGMLIEASTKPGILLFLFAFFIYHLAGHIYPTVFPYYTKEAFGWSSREIGISLGIYGLCFTLVQIFLIRLMLKKFKESMVAYIGIAIEALSMLALLFIFDGWILLLFLPVLSLGSVGMPAIQGLMSSRIAANEQGELQGASSSVMSLTAILSPLIMTQAFAFFTQQGTFHYHPAGAFGVAGLITFLVFIPLRRAIATTTGPN